ncbi:MAG: bifunctional lysylphosphatidylglycerol flippase/synthetase MprF [Solirubrobacteraceae bacterium]
MHSPHALSIVRAHGRDTLSFFKLRSDVLHLVGASGRALIGYAIFGGVMLVGGDPVGPADEVALLLAEARIFARDRGLRLGILGASEELKPVAEAAGLRCMYVGDEAIVDTAEFSTSGSSMRKLRKPVLRLEREGWSVDVRRLGELSDLEVDDLEALATRALAGAPERSFAWAMDGLRGDHQHDSVVVVGRDPDGVPHGLLHLVPSFGGRAAWSVSLMRRDAAAAPNGLMDVLVVRAIETAREEGIEEISLNFAAFSRWLREPAGLRERAGGRCVRMGSRFIQMETLLRFNQKFRPRWEPRYLAYEGRLGFARTGYAALRAEGQRPRQLRSSS